MMRAGILDRGRVAHQYIRTYQSILAANLVRVGEPQRQRARNQLLIAGRLAPYIRAYGATRIRVLDQI
jgi:hypothetical protein